jgi:glycosyltransferase involved in cell wall biosynthesis
VLVSRLFPPEPGAAAFRLGALVRALARNNHHVRVITTRPPSHLRVGRVTPGVRVSRWPVLRDRGGNVRGYVQYASFDVPAFVRLLVADRPDVVVVEPPPTTGVVVRIVCGLRRVPYVYYAGDVSTTAAAGIGAAAPVVAVLRRVERWVLRGATSVLAVSEGVASDIRDIAGDVPTTVVGTGVDTDIFTPRQVAPQQTFVYAGTMSELQGAEVFVRAFAQICRSHPGVDLVMYGQGAEQEQIEHIATELAPGRVHFRGVVSGDEVAEALSGAVAGLASLHPRRGYDFAFPTKMFAVTACGCRVIYAGPGPGRAMVEDNALGWACDWDSDVVADAMRSALDTPRSAEETARIAAWTQENASQATVAVKAADTVTAAAHRGTR